MHALNLPAETQDTDTERNNIHIYVCSAKRITDVKLILFHFLLLILGMEVTV